MGNASSVGCIQGSDEYVPVVDKAVDSGLNKQTNPQELDISEG